MSQLRFWDDLYYRNEWVLPDGYLSFARQVLPILQQEQCTSILDLGCGLCDHAIFFAQHGFEVHGIDFSSVAISAGRERAMLLGTELLHLYQMDMTEPFPFSNGQFDVVYSHLALHYFDHCTTKRVFAEIGRVLKPNGLLAIVVKSTDDVEYGKGNEIEQDMYDLQGHIRHFFSRDYAAEILSTWHLLLQSDDCVDYEDPKGPNHILRIVARKQSTP
jgi:SAM-dependent methyltransferase